MVTNSSSCPRAQVDDRGALAARLAGLLTIGVVGLPRLLPLVSGTALPTQALVFPLGLLAAFAALFWWLSSSSPRKGAGVLVGNVAMTALALGYAATDSSGLVGILLVLVVTLLGESVSVRVAVAWLIAQTLLYWWILGLGSNQTLSVLAFTGFQAFALYTSRVAQLEREGRLALQQTHAELVATQSLLADSSRSAERLRIARDLHDVVGHHLMALSLRLEASRHTAAAAREEHLDAARGVLADLVAAMRAAVADWREQPPVDFGRALRALVAGHATVGAEVELSAADDLGLADPERAHALLRAAQELLTNAQRHGSPGRIEVVVEATQDAVSLTVRDNGRGARNLVPGHGLTGLRERIEALGGTVAVESTPRVGTTGRVCLPRTAAEPEPTT